MNFNNPSTGISSLENTTYQASFKIKKKLPEGQSLAILGSIPEMGNWKQVRCQMRWTEGDVWVTEKPVVTHKYYLTYKYAIVSNRETIISWERGINRIADFAILPPLTAGATSYESTPTKKVELKDEWEVYFIFLSVLNPNEAGTDEICVQENETAGPRFTEHWMEKKLTDVDWIKLKYGKDVKPWFELIKIKNE